MGKARPSADRLLPVSDGCGAGCPLRGLSLTQPASSSFSSRLEPQGVRVIGNVGGYRVTDLLAIRAGGFGRGRRGRGCAEGFSFSSPALRLDFGGLAGGRDAAAGLAPASARSTCVSVPGRAWPVGAQETPVDGEDLGKVTFTPVGERARGTRNLCPRSPEAISPCWRDTDRLPPKDRGVLHCGFFFFFF